MEIVIIMVGSLILCLVLGVPIAFSIGIATLLGIIIGGVPIGLLGQGAFISLNNFAIMAVPFFILAGSIMETGGLSKRLVNFAQNIVGNITGGFGIVTVMACAFFGAISGSSPATVAAIGTIMIPTMIKRGYPKDFAASTTATAGGLGIVIPPSINMIMFAVLANVSVADMFLGGILPGAIITVVLCITVYIIAKKNAYPTTGVPFSFMELLKSFWQAKWALMAPVIILGGIYSGVFTPTESAVVTVVYGLVIGLFVYRELKWRDIPKILIDSAVMTGAVLIVLSTATTFGEILTIYQVPQKLTEWLLTISQEPLVILLIISGLMVVIGMFMEALAIIIILTPILMPAMNSIGVDPIHFGLIMILGSVLGLMTPPVGLNLFVASSISGISIERLSIRIIPFILAILFVFLLIIFLPQLSTGVVQLFK